MTFRPAGLSLPAVRSARNDGISHRAEYGAYDCECADTY